MTIGIVNHFKITTSKIKYSIFRGISKLYMHIAQLTLRDNYNIIVCWCSLNNELENTSKEIEALG